MALCRSPALGFPCVCGRSVLITSGALSFGAFFGAVSGRPREAFFRFPFRPPNPFFMRCCSLFFAASLVAATFASAIICSISDGPSSCGGGGSVGSANGSGASSRAAVARRHREAGSPDMSNSLRAARAGGVSRMNPSSQAAARARARARLPVLRDLDDVDLVFVGGGAPSSSATSFGLVEGLCRTAPVASRGLRARAAKAPTRRRPRRSSVSSSRRSWIL